MKLLQCVLSIKCSKQRCQLCCRQCQVWQLQSLSGLTDFQRSADVCIWCYNIDSTYQISEEPAKAYRKHFKIFKLYSVVLKPGTFGTEVQCLIPRPSDSHTKIYT
jgi:hypothetical protein